MSHRFFFAGILFYSYFAFSGVTYRVPHIAGPDWNTTITVYNGSNTPMECMISKWDDSGSMQIGQESYGIAANGTLVLRSADFGSGGVVRVETDRDVQVKVAYQFGDSESLSEFFVQRDTTRLKWLIPNTITNWFDWFGLAVANFNTISAHVVCNAYDEGQLVGTSQKAIAPFQKIVSLSDSLWPGLSYAQVDRVEIISDVPICAPISITGNDDQSRHVFFSAQAVAGASQETRTFYIPHVPMGNWQTSLAAYNVGGETASVSLSQFDASGNPVRSDVSVSIPAGETVYLDELIEPGGIATVSTQHDAAFKLSYRYGQSVSLTEFFLSTEVGSDYMVPNTIQPWFDWFGLALANFDEQAASLTLTAYLEGQEVATTQMTLQPKTKTVALSDALWQGVNYSDVDTVRIQSDVAIPAPISITGNTDQDRHVFFLGPKVIPKTAPAEWPIVWESLNGPSGGASVFLEMDPESPDTLYCGTLRGLFRTSDRGENWSVIPWTDTRHLSSIAFTEECGVVQADGITFRSRDNFADGEAIHERGYRVFASQSDIFVSNDQESMPFGVVELYRLEAGASLEDWVDITPSDELVNQVLDPYRGPNGELQQWAGFNDLVAHGSNILACLSVATAPVNALVATDSPGDDIWETALFFSDDRGASWMRVEPGLTDSLCIFNIVEHPDQEERVYLLARSKYNRDQFLPISELIKESEDFGRSWRSVTRASVPAPFIADVDAVGDSLFLTHVDFSIVELAGPSFDEWTRYDPPNVAGYERAFMVQSLIFDPRDPDTVYGWNANEAILRSDDFLATWKRVVDGFVVSQAANITVHPDNFDVIFTSTNQSFKPHRTLDFGHTWEPLTNMPSYADELAIDPHDPNHVMLIDEISKFYASHDLGSSWIPTNQRFSAARIFDFDVSNEGEGAMVVSILGTGISKFDHLSAFPSMSPELVEENWQHLYGSSDYAYDVAIDPDDSRILYATYSPKIFERHASLMKYDGRMEAENKWTEILKVENSTGMTSLAIDPQNASRMIVGTTGQRARMMVTDDRGETWRQLGQPFSFVTVHELAVDPNDEKTIFAAPWGGGLFKSRDSGELWEELSPPTTSIASIAIDSHDSSRIIIGDRTAPRVFESRDGGKTWVTLMDMDPSDYYRVFSLILHDGGLFVSVMSKQNGMISLFGDGPFSADCFRLEDHAWSQIPGDMTRGVLHFFSHETGLFAITHLRGIYRLDDGTWVDISHNLPDMGFNSVSVDDQGTIYAAGGCDFGMDLNRRIGDDRIVNEVYVTYDQGQTWQSLLNDNPFSAPVKRLFVLSSDVMVAATPGGIFVSRDAGDNWTRQAHAGLVTGIANAVVHGDRVYVGTAGQGVITGTLDADNAISWTDNDGPYPEIFNVQIDVHPDNSEIIFASAYPGGVFRSSDSGMTWRESNFGLPSFSVLDPFIQGYYSLVIDPHQRDTLYLGVFGKGVYKSRDGAATWYPLYGNQGQNMDVMTGGITKLALDPTTPDHLYVATRDRGVFISRDAGGSFEPMNAGLDTQQILTIDVAENGIPFLGTPGYGPYYYDRQQHQWIHMGRCVGLGNWAPWDRKLYQYSALLFDPGQESKVYLGHFPGGFFTSEDGGLSWTCNSFGIGNDGMFSLIAHPDDPRTLFAGTYNGVVVSHDSGASWSQSSNGMPPEQWPFTVAIDSDDANVMYAATKNGHNAGFCERNEMCGVVMKSTDGGDTWNTIMIGLDEGLEYFSLIICPFDHDMLFLSSSGGVFASADAGLTWQPINQGLPTTDHRVRDNVAQNLKLTFDNNYLILGLTNYGVWKANISHLKPSQ